MGGKVMFTPRCLFRMKNLLMNLHTNEIYRGWTKMILPPVTRSVVGPNASVFERGQQAD
jgi:hypothetical protein